MFHRVGGLAWFYEASLNCWLGNRFEFLGPNQWRFDHMLAYKPDLQLVRAESIADRQIVGAVIAKFGGALGQVVACANDDLMSIKQAGNLHWDLFPSARGPLDLGRLGDIVGYDQADST